MDLIADIGATNTRCALLDSSGQILAVERFKNDEFSGLEEVLLAYLARRRVDDRPTRAALAVAAPILGDEVSLFNRNWTFSQHQLAQDLKLSRLVVINDFAAVASALPRFTDAQATKIGGGESVPRTSIGVLGPGSGLGVSSIIPSEDDGWAVAHGEGGHVTLAPTTDEEAAVIDLMRMEHGHCSAERLISGPGLVNIYTALGHLEGRPRQTAPIRPAEITAAAAEGEPLALRTREMFFELLGSVAGNLALTVGALGGIYVAGGIVPKLLEPFIASRFRERFEAKGRYRPYMERIPTFAITEPLPAFLGLRALLGYR
jgi:glucokinase